MQGTTFIIKCTRRCNLCCTYCGERREKGELHIENLIALIKDLGTNFNENNVEFVFHGGEPLLLGREYFSKIIALQELCNLDMSKVRNTIQTNGTLVDDNWCEFFKANNFQVGISLDGPKVVQDLHRRYYNGKSTYETVMVNIKKLEEYKIKLGILSVVSDELLSYEAEKLFRFFVDNSLNNFCLLPLRPKEDSFASVEEAKSFYLKRIDYSRFMCDMFKVWLKENNEKIRIRELVSKLDSLCGGRASVCSESGNCIGRYFGIDTDGNIAHCDKFFNDISFIYGNIKEKTFSELMISEKYRESFDREIEIRDRCKDCPWFSVCKGGCLYEGVLFEKSGLKDRRFYCHLKYIYDFIYEYLDEEVLLKK